jgi:hypothetical protein
LQLGDLNRSRWRGGSYIPGRDGKRFLLNMVLEADNAPISVVHN